MQTKVKKSIGHDRMTMKAMFPNGDELNFNISRTRDTIKCSQLRTAVQLTQHEFDVVAGWLKLRTDESHMDRYVRAEELFVKADSIAGVAALLAA